MDHDRIEPKWQVGFSNGTDVEPERFVTATVPGAVQLDWAAAEGWPDHNLADHWKDYDWMEDVFWRYRATVDLPAVEADRRVFFVCGGVDYAFDVLVNGQVLHEQEGMFTPFELDLTAQAGTAATIEVRVHPAPKSRPAPADRVQANQSCKPAVAYGWDFHPRLIPLGIWRETYVETRPVTHIRRAEVLYDLDEELTRADVHVEVDLSTDGGSLRWTLNDPEGRAVASAAAHAAQRHVTVLASVEHPQLWWPHDQGDSPLYTSVVELLDDAGQVAQRLTQRVGFRRVRLVMHDGAWDWPTVDRFPKPRSNPPITMEINGRRVFCKGSNWVTPDIFPGKLTAETYREHLILVRDANMNLLRCWGGANVQKDGFFAMCDEMGIMIWQEFPLSCNRYEGTPAYLRVLDQESRSIIESLRRHPSVVLWCGGNELFNAWSGMTEQDAAMRLLNRNCYDLDPSTPFLYTSPIMGMAHGHYVFRSPHGEEVFQLFHGYAATAYTEFGCGGPASAELIRRVIPAEELFPPRLGTAWETHHAIGAWEPNSHLLLDVIEDYFGPCETLEQVVERGQLLQGEGLKCLFEEARRQKPRSAMALNWCFNEPWPAAANMSIVAHPAEPKRAYHEVARSLRPALAGARIAKFTWTEGETFDPELWLLNDSPEPLAAGRIEAVLRLDGREQLLLGWDHGGTAANKNLAGPTARFVLPRAATGRMTLVLTQADRPEWTSEYVLLYRPLERAPEEDTRRLNQ